MCACVCGVFVFPRLSPVCLACHPSQWKILGCSNKLLIGHGGSVSRSLMEMLPYTHTHTHAQVYIQNAFITASNTHQKLTCRCFLGINVPLLQSWSSWEIKLLLVHLFFSFFLCFLFLRMSFPISLSLQVCWLSLTPTAGSPKTITSTLQEGSFARSAEYRCLCASHNTKTHKKKTKKMHY